jgi:hypothetical protein
MSVKRSGRPAPAIPVTPNGDLPYHPLRLICLDFVDVRSVMRMAAELWSVSEKLP